MERGGQIGIVAGSLLGLAVALGQFVEPHEGRVNRTHADPVGIASACVGNTSVAIPGATFTDEECDALLLADAIVAVVAVRKLVTVPLSDSEMIGAASFVYNFGWAKFAGSTFRAKINAGDKVGAAAELARWVCGGKATGKADNSCEQGGMRLLPGLVVRRAREARLFLS